MVAHDVSDFGRAITSSGMGHRFLARRGFQMTKMSQ